MNRAFKFRAWIGDKNGFMASHKDLFIDRNYGDMADIDHMMQYTGLNDVNGVEIYEGDIIKAHAFDSWNGSDTEIKAVIEYIPSAMVYVLKDGYHDWLVEYTSHFEEPCIEVIGNIYENPELAKSINA